MLSDIAVFGIRLLSSLVDMGDTFEVCCIGNYVLVFWNNVLLWIDQLMEISLDFLDISVVLKVFEPLACRDFLHTIGRYVSLVFHDVGDIVEKFFACIRTWLIESWWEISRVVYVQRRCDCTWVEVLLVLALALGADAQHKVSYNRLISSFRMSSENSWFFLILTETMFTDITRFASRSQ